MGAFLLLCGNCKNTKTAGAPGQTFCIAFYNVENLFDIVHDGAEYDLYTPSPTGWNQYAYNQKLSKIASALKALNADIVGLCEIENRRAMQDLRVALKRRGLRYPYMAIADSAVRSNTCPVLFSRFPIVQTASIEVSLPDTINTTRSILAATVGIENDSLVIFVNHWPSKHWPVSYRKKAAQALRTTLADIPRGRDYIILGDLNANFDEWESVVGSTHNDCNDSTSVNHSLGTIRHDGAASVCYTRWPAVDELEHVDLWTELDPRCRCSYVYRGQPQTPDHILVPASLFDSSGFSYLPGSFDVFTWQGRLLWYGNPFRWEVRYREGIRQHTTRGFSDHLPIFARVQLSSFTTVEKRGRLFSDHCRNRLSGGFETGFEGWTPVTGKLRWTLDNHNPYTGEYHVRLTGKLSNFSAIARKSWRIPAGSTHLSMSLRMRGAARIAFRYRWNDDKYRFVDIESVKKPGRSRYAPFASREWQKLCVDFGTPSPKSTVIGVELRAAKGVVDLHIDDIHLEAK
ncbi:MAG: endonuclease/exonuclease/phosphatase family protein [Chitinivibrionales bacterium]